MAGIEVDAHPSHAVSEATKWNTPRFLSTSLIIPPEHHHLERSTPTTSTPTGAIEKGHPDTGRTDSYPCHLPSLWDVLPLGSERLDEQACHGELAEHPSSSCIIWSLPTTLRYTHELIPCPVLAISLPSRPETAASLSCRNPAGRGLVEQSGTNTMVDRLACPPLYFPSTRKEKQALYGTVCAVLFTARLRQEFFTHPY